MDEFKEFDASLLRVKSVNLSDITIPPAIIEMVPESVARENGLIPIAEENGVVQIATSNPFDYDTMQKVQFILARDIQPVLAPEEQIVAAINRHYGQP
jgi:type IV pilus assembly protein PilB